jgi:hypothetical protein
VTEELCDCPLRDRALTLVLARLDARGGCRPCRAIDVKAELARRQSRTPFGLYREIAVEIGADPDDMDELHLVGDGWDLLVATLDEVEATTRHTCQVTA